MNDFHKECFYKNLDERFDVDLKKIPELTWLPWVGKGYSSSRILIIAESHYTDKKEKEAAEAEKQKILMDSLYTRQIIAEYPISGKAVAGWRNSTFDNLHRLMVSDSLSADIPRRALLWRSLGYMNIAQRPMWYKKPPERPTPKDFETGWRVFTEVIRILEPRLCIFAGLEACRSFHSEMIRLGIVHDPVKRCQRIGRSYTRLATCSLTGMSVPLVFIQHPSKYFSWSLWQDFVFGGERRSHLESLRAQVFPQSLTI